MELTASISFRQKEIVNAYLRELDQHIEELRHGRTSRALEIREFAAILHVHPIHLSNTIKEVTGRSSCDHYEDRLVRVSKELLLDSRLSIAEVATRLTYDPSNFTKFFKHFTGITPRQFRKQSSS